MKNEGITLVKTAHIIQDEMEILSKKRNKTPHEQSLHSALSFTLAYLDRAGSKKIVRGDRGGVYCPKCGGSNLFNLENDRLFNYCPDCGQRIEYGFKKVC